MHDTKLSPKMVARVTERVGKPHPFDVLDPQRTALVVIDMQNHFVKQGFPVETPAARAITPGVNRLAAAVRARGGHVVWIKNSTNDTLESWSVYHTFLSTPERAKIRYDSMTEGAEGHELWGELDVKPEDAQLTKKRFSAFIQGSSTLESHLRARGFDSILIVGVATQVCCESTARDAAMLNFKVVMVSDACATSADDLHNASLNNFYSNFGDVLTIDETVAALDRGAHAASAAA